MGKVYLKHPLTGDTQEVDDTHNQLVPWMVKGYVQDKTPGVAASIPKPAPVTTVKES